mmetsp:Transcript_73004/g.237363  ORF Transcript_73004/g.237363 Transcript_73004/m.237363 type:complete len:218 (+) Transcript_73004:863-1516(+)
MDCTPATCSSMEASCNTRLTPSATTPPSFPDRATASIVSPQLPTTSSAVRSAIPAEESSTSRVAALAPATSPQRPHAAWQEPSMKPGFRSHSPEEAQLLQKSCSSSQSAPPRRAVDVEVALAPSASTSSTSEHNPQDRRQTSLMNMWFISHSPRRAQLVHNLSPSLQTSSPSLANKSNSKSASNLDWSASSAPARRGIGPSCCKTSRNRDSPSAPLA